MCILPSFRMTRAFLDRTGFRITIPATGFFALGALASLGFPPFGSWPATLGSLIMLLHYAAGASSARHAATHGWWFGFGLGCASLTWIAHAFTYQDAMPAWLGWPAVVLLAAYTGCYWALPLYLARRLAGRARLLAFATYNACFFVFAEWLRGVLLTGFSWNPLGIVWLPFGEVARSAATIGAIGLSGITMLIAGFAASALRGSAWPAIVLSTAAMAVTVMSAGPRAAPDTGTAISLVQGNIDQAGKWRPGTAEAQLERYRELSGKPHATAEPRLVFWPEGAIIDTLDAEPVVRRSAGSVLGPGDLLFTGGTGGEGSGGFSNSVFVLDSTGRILARYDKAHLVPFGEYLPLSPLLSALSVTRLVPGEAAFVPGKGPETLDVGGIRVGVSICYEIIFPGAVVDRTERPAFLFNPSNDAWFGGGGPEQHLSQARLRAIEEGLPIIRVTSTGVTAVIRSDGSIAETLPPHQAMRLDTVLPAAGRITPIGRWGMVFPLAAAAALLALILVASASGSGSRTTWRA